MIANKLEDEGRLMRRCCLIFNRCSSVLITEGSILLNEGHLCSKSIVRNGHEYCQPVLVDAEMTTVFLLFHG